MKLLSFALAAGLTVSATGSAFAAEITGAGATFPFPVYAKWAEAYKKETGTSLNYQSIGSSGGIRQIRAKTVDFGATDAPLSGDALQKDGLVQFPSVMGGVVPVVNIPGVATGQLKLTGAVLADLFAGRIAKWNDARLAEINPGLSLPNAPVTPVYRSDGSGTTSVFTTYLAEVSPAWKSGPGAGASVQWPAGQGGKGNEGVAALVKQVPNTIGYVEFAYAKQNGISYAVLENRNGKFVAPEARTFQAAAAGADWSSAPGFGISLTNQAGDEAWPITAPTFILVPKTPERPEQVAEALKFFAWAFDKGDQMSADLDYVPLPAPVKDMVRRSWAQEIRTKAGQPLFNM